MKWNGWRRAEEKFSPCEILKKHARDGTKFYKEVNRRIRVSEFSPLEDAPDKTKSAEETSAKKPREAGAAAVIDTSKMAKGQREALELAEAARDPLEDRGSFASNLFIGRYDFDRIYPYPAQSAEDRAAGEEFLQKLESYLREHVDPDEIDRTGEIPPENFKGLAEIGAFGIKVPKKYGGLGLSQCNYGRAAVLLGSWDGNVAALVSAHQSIGVAQPLLLFGTEEQKQKYLPRVAGGEISAFALTEETRRLRPGDDEPAR